MKWFLLALALVYLTTALLAAWQDYRRFRNRPPPPNLDRGILRCRAEQAHLVEEIRAGAEPVEGYLLGLVDWSAEERALELEKEKAKR